MPPLPSGNPISYGPSRIPRVGVALGLAFAAAGTRVLASVLYGVGSTDVGIFLGTAALLVIMAWVANWIPARRATRIHLVTALRYG